MVRTLIPILVLGLLAGACSQDLPGKPQEIAPDGVAALTPGQLHNELLARFHASSGRELPAEARIDIALGISNEILAAYGEPAVSREQVVEWMELGRSLMREAMESGPFAITDRVLQSEGSRLWWQAFCTRPLEETARASLAPLSRPVLVGKLNPRPAIGPVSRLDVADMPDDPLLQDLVDIAVHSADYWSGYDRDTAAIGSSKPTADEDQGWGVKLFQHFCIATTDAVAGALVGAASGPAGVVTGPVAGYLASEGAVSLAGW